MKKFKLISDIIALVILAAGLVLCVIPYVYHALNCTGCSSHGIHPTVEMIAYSLVVILALTVFGISRLILWLHEKKTAAPQKTEKAKTGFEKISNLITLIILALGVLHFLILAATSIAQFGFNFLMLAINLLIIPLYAMAGGAFFGISRWILQQNENKSVSVLEAEKSKSAVEKLSVIIPIAIMLGGVIFCISLLVKEQNFSCLLYLYPFILMTAAAFAVFKLIIRLTRGSKDFAEGTASEDFKREKSSLIIALILMAAGFVHSFCMFGAALWQCFTINGSFSDSFMEFAYLIPYSIAAAAVMWVCHLRMRDKTICGNEVRQGEV